MLRNLSAQLGERQHTRASSQKLGQRNRKLLVLAGLSVLLVAASVASVAVGAVAASPGQVIAILFHPLGLELPWAFDARQQAVVLAIRLPRVLLGLFIGAGLAVSGAAMQGLFRNPLADPGLIGVSSGASLVVAVVVIFLVAIILQAAVVAVCGPVGFVALVAPHMTRGLLRTSDARQILPTAALMGALLLTAADLTAREIVSPAELPVGLLTTAIGAPIALVLLRRLITKRSSGEAVKRSNAPTFQRFNAQRKV